MTKRLIEDWLPIGELGVESIRERTPMTPFPAPNRLHVWWARRPLVASRAAILASILPIQAEHDTFLKVIGIHGDPIASKKRILAARRKGERFDGAAYSYPRAFGYLPTASDDQWIACQTKQLGLDSIALLDPTAGGGAIPLEGVRLGLTTFGNDLNPVAALIERATIDYPIKFGRQLLGAFRTIADEFTRRREERLAEYFPEEPDSEAVATNFLWARTVRCPHCEGTVPLSPNWRLAPDGTGVRLEPVLGRGPGEGGRYVRFSIVTTLKEQSPGTVTSGDAQCPFVDCARLISGDDIKEQAQSGRMGEQLYAIVFKRREITGKTKAGKIKEKWIRGYRPPRVEDGNMDAVDAALEQKMPEWEAMDLVPTEPIAEGHKTDEPRRYGMFKWTDMFSSRQLLAHATSVEIYRQLIVEYDSGGQLNDLTRAAFVYLAFSFDKLRDYNSRMARWHVNRELMVNTFDRHDFAFKWSFAEMPALVNKVGNDWAIEQTAKCISDLIGLTGDQKPINKPQQGLDFGAESTTRASPQLTLSCKSGDSLDHIPDGSIDVVVVDPPYYDNVMYAELSDFFYVWLKRTAAYVFPDLFKRPLTDKETEAVANPSKFQVPKGAKALAGRDYQQRMSAIFAEMQRVS